MRVELTASQLDLPSLTSLSVAGCGRLYVGVANLATSVALLQVAEIRPHKKWLSILLRGTSDISNFILFYCNHVYKNVYSDEILVKYEHF